MISHAALDYYLLKHPTHENILSYQGNKGSTILVLKQIIVHESS